jgi:two-component system sensor kinase FixL
VMGLGCFFLVRLSIHSRGIYGWQAGGIVIAAAIAMLGPFLDIFQISPFVPFVSTASGLAVGIVTVALLLTFLRQRDILTISRTAIIQSISDGIVVIDEDSRVVFLNPAAESLMGRSVAGVMGKPLGQAWPELRSIWVDRADKNNEVILYHENTLRTFDLRVSAIRDAQGRAVSRVIALRDITERKYAEKALQESEERYRSIMEQASESIFLYDLETKQIIEANNAYHQLFGYTAEEIRALTLYDIVNYDREAIDRLVEQIRNEKRVWIGERQHRQKNGSWVDVEASGSLIQFGGKQAMSVVVRDITDRKWADAQRQKLIADLEAKNAELERFTYTVSHDLKSPLITISGFVGFLEQDTQTGNLEGVKEDIIQINSAVAKMQRLLSELLELSRVGRLTNPPEEVSFEAITREVVELVHGRIEARGVKVEIAPDLPTVYGDRVRLVEVMQNLVDNACKFMGDQPRPRIEIGTRHSEVGPVFYVRDNGIGIDPQYHEKVFGLFDKLDPQSEGTGVGLALVKRIVETHGGRIWIESEVSAGSTFCFTLADIL